MRHWGGRQGFSLIELSVVLIIVALVAAMGVVTTVSTIEVAKRAQTEKKLDIIENALMAFRIQYNRLPCPGDLTLTAGSALYGRESSSNGSCVAGPPAATYIATNASGFQTAEGSVPTQALNLPDEYMFDGWGRKIVYAVDALAAEPNAFDLIVPSSNDCTITIKDAANANRSSGAIYALVSFGENGHGGFVGANRISSGSGNPSEQTNCHCDSTGAYNSGFNTATFVQKEVFEYTNSTSVFDDLVRFKERWQLQNNVDYVTVAKRREYDLAIGRSDGSTYLYKRSCHGWSPSSTTSVRPSGGTSATTVAGIGFSKDNNTMLIRSNATNTCQPYYISASTIATCGTLTNCIPAAQACPAYGASDNLDVAFGNDYAAFSYSATPYLRLYRMSNTSTTTPLFSMIAPVFYTGHQPASQPTLVVVSKNMDYLFLSDQSSYARLYAKTQEGTYRLFDSTYFDRDCSDYTGGLSCTRLGGAAFSPDGNYFAISTRANPGIWVWKIQPGGTPFVPVASGGTNPLDWLNASAALNAVSYLTSPPVVAFSPDSQYLAAAGENIVGGVHLFKIDAAAAVPDDAFTAVTLNNYAGGGSYTVNTTAGIRFSADSNILLVPADYGAAVLPYAIAQYWKKNTLQFDYLSGSIALAPLAGSTTIRRVTLSH